MNKAQDIKITCPHCSNNMLLTASSSVEKRKKEINNIRPSNKDIYLLGWPSFFNYQYNEFLMVSNILSKVSSLFILSDKEWIKPDANNHKISSLGYTVSYVSDMSLDSSHQIIILSEESLYNELYKKNYIEKIKESKSYIIHYIYKSTLSSIDYRMIYENSADFVVLNDDIDNKNYISLLEKNNIPYKYVKNYINEKLYPYIDRNTEIIRVGHLSSNDFSNYTENFPLLYEYIFEEIDANFTVMSWDYELKNKYSWHEFNEKWKFLSPNRISDYQFVSAQDIMLNIPNHYNNDNKKLDILKYQLTGSIVVSLYRKEYENILTGENGFLCKSQKELKEACSMLKDKKTRKEISLNASKSARMYFNEEEHLKDWRGIIYG